MRSTLLAVVPKDLKMINELHLSTHRRQIGMKQRVLTTLVRTQACKSEIRVNLMGKYDLTTKRPGALWRECDVYADYLQI